MWLLISVHVVLVIFVYLVYAASSELGSPNIVYRRLLEVASKSRSCQEPISHVGQSCGPATGNFKGSYVTMLSSGGLVFGIINIVGNFGTVFVDNVSFSFPYDIARNLLMVSFCNNPDIRNIEMLGILGKCNCCKTIINT